jgi:hypothetical protein
MSGETSARIFRGPTAGPRDRARLSAQIERIRAWALTREWFTLREARIELERLFDATIFPESSISAQLRNLAKPSAGRLRCKKEKRPRGGGVWEYRLRATPEIRPAAIAALEPDEPPRKISWPATFVELEEADYGYTGTSKECACGARFLWFITPARKWMGLSVIEGDRLVPHRAICPNARRLRAANASHQARANPRPLQASLF